MSGDWRYSDWRPGGERTTFEDITFDSTIHCGNGHDFRIVAPDHYRFRARPGLVTYAWRFFFCIESPGDGREVTLEVADFNHFGQELWQEQATVFSTDGETWADVGIDNITLVPWTATGHADEDASIDDGWHPPYGVQHRVKLTHPVMWFATPTPYTLEHSRDHLHSLADRCDFFSVDEIGRTHFADGHGFPILAAKVARGSDESKLRVVVIAGEHPSEFAGMFAAEGLLEELLRASDLLADFSFWVVPVVNVDGVAYGRSYHNLDPGDPVRAGVNLGRDWAARTQPETRAVWDLIQCVRPHCVVNLHNGRHRTKFEAYAPLQPQVATLMRCLRKHLPLPLEHWRPFTETGEVNPEVLREGIAETSLLIETLVLQKLPGCATFRDSYRRAGIHILRGLVEALREIHARPQLLACAEELSADPVSLDPQDFLAQLPWFYHSDDFTSPHAHAIWSLEVNALPLLPGTYDVWMETPRESPPLVLTSGKRTWPMGDGWTLIPSVPIPARILSLELEHPVEGGRPALTSLLIAPEGTPLELGRDHARLFDRYVRDTQADSRPHLQDWQPFHTRLMSDDFGPADLEDMFSQITDWAARRQVVNPSDPHDGALWSEEDKYDARDAAAACACFTRRFAQTGDERWRDRALLAREYVYRNQMSEPGNPQRHGGFVHMVQGIWGTNFTRLAPPYPGIDGVDTCAIVHILCTAHDWGLPIAEPDVEALRAAADWVCSSEFLPGVFKHHEGATHDCQNSNALSISALARAHAKLAECSADPDARWLEAAGRGLDHYLSGQESIGVWPYIFAHVGERGQAFGFANVPDHGIGLYHLTRVAPPQWNGAPLRNALRRAARWYLGICRLEDDTIDLEYDRKPDLAGDICFSGFTWCRFTAAATLTRISSRVEPEPWRHLALRLMEHVRTRRWQTSSRESAPVVAHARPEAPLATWCQAAEWDAVMLGEMIGDLNG